MVIAPVASAGEALEDMPAGVPLVTVDGDPRRAHALVTIDQVAGARAATQLLLDAGHRTVWHVSGPADWYDAAGRIEGWKQALQAAGAEVPPLVPADWSAAAGYAAGQMLARMPEVTAVFTANDHLALGLLRALHERGRRVPHDLSVVGFDDVPESAYFIPPLTTVRPDFDAVAQAGLDLLLAQIDRRRDRTGPHRHRPGTGRPRQRRLAAFPSGRAGQCCRDPLTRREC